MTNRLIRCAAIATLTCGQYSTSQAEGSGNTLILDTVVLDIDGFDFGRSPNPPVTNNFTFGGFADVGAVTASGSDLQLDVGDPGGLIGGVGFLLDPNLEFAVEEYQVAIDLTIGASNENDSFVVALQDDDGVDAASSNPQSELHLYFFRGLASLPIGTPLTLTKPIDPADFTFSLDSPPVLWNGDGAVNFDSVGGLRSFEIQNEAGSTGRLSVTIHEMRIEAIIPEPAAAGLAAVGTLILAFASRRSTIKQRNWPRCIPAGVHAIASHRSTV